MADILWCSSSDNWADILFVLRFVSLYILLFFGVNSCVLHVNIMGQEHDYPQFRLVIVSVLRCYLVTFGLYFKVFFTMILYHFK